AWLCRQYPDTMRTLSVGKDPSPDLPFEVLEYIDDTEHVLVVVGQPLDTTSRAPWEARSPTGAAQAVLERTPNRVGRCTAVVPTRLGLDMPKGQFDGLPGLYQLQARAMALFFISSERAIFPETWFISRPNEQVQVVQ